MRCVPARDFNVNKAKAWRSAINDAPPYQRESAIWSLDKQQLFVDSLLNGYDVPKIYLHDLRGKHPTQVYAVVDGRQRLTTIWRFLDDELPLADDFRIELANLPPGLPADVVHPKAGDRWRDLHPAWQEVLRRTYLAVVLIQNATEEDIEDLFSRLNNGEPLNAAEKRNAMGGDMVALVREVGHDAALRDRVRFPNTRSQHLDLAARLLAIARAETDGSGQLPDLRARAMDAFVRAHRRLAPEDRAALRAAADRGLRDLAAVFGPSDPLLGTQGAVVLATLFLAALRDATPRTADGSLDPVTGARLRAFLAGFDGARRAALDTEAADPVLTEFTHLMQHGTNERRSLERRVAILAEAWHRWGDDVPAPVPAAAAG